jgi:hypothetical protein
MLNSKAIALLFKTTRRDKAFAPIKHKKGLVLKFWNQTFFNNS